MCGKSYILLSCTSPESTKFLALTFHFFPVDFGSQDTNEMHNLHTAGEALAVAKDDIHFSTLLSSSAKPSSVSKCCSVITEHPVLV